MGTPNTLPTLHYLRNAVVHFLDEQVPAAVFQKMAHLTVLIKSLDFPTTSQTASFEQDEKIMLQLVCTAPSSFSQNLYEKLYYQSYLFFDVHKKFMKHYIEN